MGGLAVIYHSQPRFTNDIDLFIKADAENAKATYAALADFGASLQDIRAEDFTDRNSFFRFGREPKSFDILPAIPGVDFDAAWERRVETIVDPDSGLKAFFISRDDLITAKLAAARPQDLLDVDAIRKTVDSQRPSTKKKPPEPSAPNQ
ncbi:MAG TPA: DUF6036 family nucleotidyltransferase [Terriglobia bacterium]|nr:DUF6036 family nucleotidyltransferase [Terriglobia bacterium]